MTDIYLHIDARMADYIRTHPYCSGSCVLNMAAPIGHTRCSTPPGAGVGSYASAPSECISRLCHSMCARMVGAVSVGWWIYAR